MTTWLVPVIWSVISYHTLKIHFVGIRKNQASALKNFLRKKILLKFRLVKNIASLLTFSCSSDHVPGMNIEIGALHKIMHPYILLHS